MEVHIGGIPHKSRESAAEYLGVKPQTLATWASTRRYQLPFVMAYGRAWYAVPDLDENIRKRSRGK